MKKNKKEHGGQVALVMVLIMTVISAVAVSLASRSTQETRVQQMSVDSTKALLAAQAGIEESKAKEVGVTGSLSEGQQYQVTRSEIGATGIVSSKVASSSVIEVNLTGASGITGLKIYWKPVVSGQETAIFVTDVQSDKSVDYAFDSSGSNGFTGVSSGGTLNGVAFDYVTPTAIPVVASSKLLRITSLGSSVIVGIEPVGGSLPAQSIVYKSIASLDDEDSSVKYGIEYEESKSDQLPSIFDYALFSGGSILQ